MPDRCGTKLRCISGRRKRDPQQRRRDLCDAALELLGEGGARGLSHPKVDQRAALPPGTTSAYYRTRKALLLGAAARLNEIDLKDIGRMTELAESGGSQRFSGTEGLAALVFMSGQPPALTRTKARYELAVLAGRDPDLAEVMNEVVSRFDALARALLVQWQPADTDADPASIDEQVFAVLHFISGVQVDFVRGGTPHSVEHIDQTIQAILTGVRDHYRRR